MSSETQESSGVQRLIDRLHEDGVNKGKAEADDVVANAKAEAMTIVDQAKQEAEAILANARQEADRTIKAGEEAVRLAGRDATLRLSEELREDFVRKLRRLIDHSLTDPDFVKRLLLAIALKTVPERIEGKVDVSILSLPEGWEKDPDAALGITKEQLDTFFQELGGEALRDGLSFHMAEADSSGIRIRIVDQDLEIDLTTETVTQLLLKHVAPRFRAMLEER